MLLRASLLIAAAIALVHGPVRADDAEAERERGRALVTGLRSVDPTLLGTYHFAYDQRGRNIGHQELVVERAPEGSEAVYRVRLRGECALEGLGGEKVDEETLLDERLALVSHTATLERDLSAMGRDMSIRRTLRNTRRDGEWIGEQVEGKTKQVVRLRTDEPDYGRAASQLLLVRKLDLTTAGTLRLPMIYAAFDDEGCEASVEDVTVKVHPAAPFQHRGQERDAHQVEVVGELRCMAVVTPERALLAHWVGPATTADRLVAVDSAEDARKDLEAPDMSPDALAARAVALRWFEVLAGERPFESLHDVVDWAALRDQEAERRAEVQKLSPEAYATRARERHEQMRKMVGDLAKDMLNMARGSGRVRVSGEEAIFTSIGDATLVLRRSDGGWRIVRAPGR